MAKISELPLEANPDGSETVVMVKNNITRRAALGGMVGAAATPHVAAAQLARDQVVDMVDVQRIFVDLPLAEAEAATSEGQFFKLVDTASGLAEVRRRTASGSDLLYSEATSAALASPDPDKGAALVGYNIGLAGSTDGVVADLARENVSLSRFVPKGIRTDLMNGEHVGDVAAYINSALDSGENIVNPFRLAAIAEPIRIKHDGQSFSGRGTYNNEIRWLANEPALNMIELLSSRRDGGNPSQARTNQSISGALLSSAPGSSMANAIWVENGIFHSRIENLRLLNFHGEITEAAIKLDSGGGMSYPVGLAMRNVVITGINKDPLQSAAIPIGIWCESMIECEFDMVKVFNVSDAFVFGSPGNFRAVLDSSFTRCHVEIGNRRGGANNATGFRFYSGSNLNFDGCKINAGINDDGAWPSVDDQTCMEFMAHPDYHPMRNLNFWGCRFWQVTPQQRELVYVNSGAQLDRVLFDSPRVVGVTGTPGFIGIAADYDGHIEVRNENFSGLSLARPCANLAGRRSITHNAVSLDAGAVTTFDLGDDDGAAFGTPVAVSASVNLQGLHLSWCKTSATGVSKFNLWNPIGESTRDLPPARYAIRHYQPKDIRGSISIPYDPPAINTNIGANRRLRFPGVQPGDCVAVGFVATTAGGMSGVIAEAWVDVANYVTVRLFNPLVNKNFVEGLLTVFWLAPNYDTIGSQTYNSASLATLSSTGHTLAAPGASLGDFVEVSFDKDQQNVIIWGEVTDAGFATVRGFNSDPGAIDLPEGEIFVGIRKRHTRL